MNKIFELLGAVTNFSALVRLKIAIVGIGALMAGLVFAASGIEGSILRGCLMAACGTGLLGVVFLSLGKTDQEIVEPLAPQRIEVTRDPSPPGSCDHDWVDQDEMSNHDPRHYLCSKCGLELFG